MVALLPFSFGELMYDSLPSIKRICEQKGVSAEELLAYLLNVFLQSHLMSYGLHAQLPESQKPTVMNEVMSIAEQIRIYDGEAKLPASIIDAIYHSLKAHRMMNLNNAGVESQPENVNKLDPRTMKPMHETIARAALKAEVLVLILKEGLNVSENIGLQIGINFDNRNKPGDSSLGSGPSL